MGADGVELDVRLSLGGRGGSRLVVFHNPLPDGESELDALPSFDDVLDACGDRMLVNVEVKNSDDEGGHDPTMAMVAPVVDAMRRRGPAWAERWLFSSFDLATMNHCRLVAPDVPTAYLVYEATDEAIAAAVAGGHAAIHPWDGTLTADRVAASHAAGLTVNTWTCNDADRIRELASMGVDGVCTDVPDVARDALGRTDDAASPSWWPSAS